MAVKQPAETLPRRPIRRGGAWVFTGGARGITAFVAREMALRYGLKLHLVGTAPEPAIEPAWRTLDEAGLKQLKASVMQRARGSGQSPLEAWQDVEKALEIDKTLREFASEGIRAVYHSCDVSDRDALAAVLDRVRAIDGPIEGIVHGAGVGKDSRFDRKERKRVEKCIRAKVDGAAALVELTRHDPLKYFVAFGSISGRFGANGHTDYSSANDMLAKQVDWFRRQRPEVAAVAFHWHAWGDVGMATKPETRLALELIDMQFMPAREGLEHLINELEIGAPEGEVLITDDRYYRAFYPAETLDEVANAKPPAGALLEGPVETIGSGKIRGSVRLDPAKDPFLVEHRLDDRPLLPVVIGMEMLCEAAAALDPAATVVELRNVEAMNGLRFHTDDPQTASITAERVDEQTVACLLSADFHTRTGALVDRDRPYLRGQVVLAAARSEIPVPRLPVPRQAWQKVSYAARGGKFFLGPPLRRLRKMIVGPTQAWGRIAAPALVELAGNRRDVRGWIFPSALVDACLYATGLLAWQSVQPGAHLPVSFGRIRLGTLPSPGEACIVESSYRGREGRTASFDFTLFGNDGRVVLAVEDYRIAWLA